MPNPSTIQRPSGTTTTYKVDTIDRSGVHNVTLPEIATDNQNVFSQGTSVYGWVQGRENEKELSFSLYEDDWNELEASILSNNPLLTSIIGCKFTLTRTVNPTYGSPTSRSVVNYECVVRSVQDTDADDGNKTTISATCNNIVIIEKGVAPI